MRGRSPPHGVRDHPGPRPSSAAITDADLLATFANDAPARRRILGQLIYTALKEADPSLEAASITHAMLICEDDDATLRLLRDPLLLLRSARQTTETTLARQQAAAALQLQGRDPVGRRPPTHALDPWSFWSPSPARHSERRHSRVRLIAYPGHARLRSRSRADSRTAAPLAIPERAGGNPSPAPERREPPVGAEPHRSRSRQPLRGDRRVWRPVSDRLQGAPGESPDRQRASLRPRQPTPPATSNSSPSQLVARPPTSPTPPPAAMHRTGYRRRHRPPSARPRRPSAPTRFRHGKTTASG
jgi:hypothetical protein